MSRVSNWLKGMLGLAVLMAFGLALAWLLRTAGQGTAMGQREGVPNTPPPAEVATPANTPLPEQARTLTATVESRETVRILYAVQPPGGPVTLWALDYNPSTDKASEQALTTSPFPDYQWLRAYKVSISPDGQYIALSLRGGAEGFEFGVWVVDAEGTWIRIPPITEGLSFRFVAWIPGTDRILVQDMDGSIVGTVKHDGTNLQTFSLLRTGNNFRSAAGGAVSPDGQRIALAIIEENEVWLASIDGTKLREVAFPDKAVGGAAPAWPVWSPDGTRLAYMDSTSNDMQQIRVIDLDGSYLQYLSSDNAHHLFPVWSPDSIFLVYIRSETRILNWLEDPTAWNSSLWIAQAETGQYSELVPSVGKACWSPAWLPDGSGVVFISNRKGQSDVWIVNRDGTGLRQLTNRGDIIALDVLYSK